MKYIVAMNQTTELNHFNKYNSIPCIPLICLFAILKKSNSACQ